MRRAPKVDGNHAQIRDALRSCGCYVLDLAAVGDGCPDLLVGTQQRWTLVEVKDPSQPPSKRRLTPDQAELHQLVRAHRLPLAVVHTIEEALAAVRGPSAVVKDCLTPKGQG